MILHILIGLIKINVNNDYGRELFFYAVLSVFCIKYASVVLTILFNNAGVCCDRKHTDNSLKSI